MNFFANPAQSFLPFGSLNHNGDQGRPIVPIDHVLEKKDQVEQENIQLKGVLATLTMKYKFAEDARKVMTRRNSVLMDDNQFLQEKLLDVEKRRILAEKEALEKSEKVILLETSIKEILSDGLEEARKKKKYSNAVDKATSMLSLEKNDSFVSDDEPIPKEITICGQPATIDSIVELKEVLQKREESFCKVYERDRVNRAKIIRLTREIERLKNTNSWKATELEYKSNDLKMKVEELASARKELQDLKHKIVRKPTGNRLRPKRKAMDKKQDVRRKSATSQ